MYNLSWNVNGQKLIKHINLKLCDSLVSRHKESYHDSKDVSQSTRKP